MLTWWLPGCNMKCQESAAFNLFSLSTKVPNYGLRVCKGLKYQENKSGIADECC